MTYPAPKKVRLVYFTGTGCTGLAAGTLADALRSRGIDAVTEIISVKTPPDGFAGEDMLILLFPVYAFAAPRPVYDYIGKLKPGAGCLSAVISVSGGGEVSPNTACRSRTIRLLEEKGVPVVYEQMLVMPSNVLVATPFELSAALLRALPDKLGRIADSLLAGVVRRVRPFFIDRALAAMGPAEQAFAGQFGKRITVSPSCSGCGICWSQCPTGNITCDNGKPAFGRACVTCMKCLYNCPQKALSPRFGKSIVLREGFSLADFQKAASREDAAFDAKQRVGIAWAGVIRYLGERD